MITYRVVRRRYAGLSGEGARRYGGRFNPPGIPAIYTSESIALALLEVLVHVDKAEVPKDYVVMAIRFPSRNMLQNPGRNLIGAGQVTPDQFERRFYRRTVLRVPSIIVPREYNFILLPETARFVATVEWMEPLNFDRRLFSER